MVGERRGLFPTEIKYLTNLQNRERIFDKWIHLKNWNTGLKQVSGRQKMKRHGACQIALSFLSED